LHLSVLNIICQSTDQLYIISADRNEISLDTTPIQLGIIGKFVTYTFVYVINKNEEQHGSQNGPLWYPTNDI